jgi:hypothetical protein
MSEKREIEHDEDGPPLKKPATESESEILNCQLKSKIEELEKRSADGVNMSIEMNEEFQRRIDVAEQEVLDLKSKISIINYLKKYNYTVKEQHIGGLKKIDLSEQIIDAILKDDKNSPLPKESSKIVSTIEYKNYVIYKDINTQNAFINQNIALASPPPFNFGQACPSRNSIRGRGRGSLRGRGRGSLRGRSAACRGSQ